MERTSTNGEARAAPTPGNVTPSADLAARCNESIATRGEKATATAFGMSVNSLARLVARLPVRAGTIALAEAGLRTLATSGPSEAA